MTPPGPVAVAPSSSWIGFRPVRPKACMLDLSPQFASNLASNASGLIFAFFGHPNQRVNKQPTSVLRATSPSSA